MDRLLGETVALARDAMAARPGGLAMLGIAGAQGSGKSTVARALAGAMAEEGVACALLSIDDLYLPRADRAALARTVHPLLRTRGVPGTHDIALGLALIAALERGEGALLPRFDKAADDRLPVADWPAAPAACRLLLLEGWCVGARPQPDAALDTPVNALEAREDADGRWRHYVNRALAGAYQRLFDRIDRLVLLAAPDFSVVHRWRDEQEDALRAGGGAGVMDAAQIARFIQHYERITRHMLADLPARADLVVRLDDARTAVRFAVRHTH